MAAAITFDEIENYCNEYKKRNGSNFLVLCATINEYHHFCVHPLMGFEMLMNCVREPDNSHDNNAIKVAVPVLRHLRDVSDVVVRDFDCTALCKGLHLFMFFVHAS